MDLAHKLQAELDAVAAPFVRQLGLVVEAADAESATLRLPITPTLVHGGGVVCGQALMTAADTAMIVALSAALGGFRPMTTVQLQTSFLRPVPGDTAELRIVCRLLRKGKTLGFGDVQVLMPDGKLAAHATTTYALL
jgi:uncharacterized protein (TIGR00369 family)